MRPALPDPHALPPLELVIDELVIDAEVLGPSGHAPSLVLALQGELGRLLGAPAELGALRAGGGLSLDSLSAGRVATSPGSGPGLAAALAQALAGALAGAASAPESPSPPSSLSGAAQPSSGRKEPT
ncbi:MAG: hypothetical protein U1A78_38265 [Polyangia bacterium]